MSFINKCVYIIVLYSFFVTNSFGLGCINKTEKTSQSIPEKILSAKVIESIATSVDGKQFVYVVSQITPSFLEIKNVMPRKWISQLYFQNKNGEIIILNSWQKAVSFPAWSPDDSVVAYLSPGGKYQSIWIINPVTLKTYKLLELNRDIKAFKWDHHGKKIAFIAGDNQMTLNSRKKLLVDVSKDYVNSRIYLIAFDSKTKNRKDIVALTPASVTIFFDQFFDWALDDRRIIYAYQPRPGLVFPMQSKLAMVDIWTKKIKTFRYFEDHPVYQPLFSPNGKWIAFGSSMSAEKKASMLSRDADIFSRICVMNTHTEKVHCLANTFNQNPIPFGWNPSSTEIWAFDIYKTDGIQLYKINIDSKIPAKRFSIIDGYIDPSTLNISRDHTTMSYVYETVLKPPEVFATKTVQFHPQQITHFQKKLNISLGNTQVIQWKSTDGAQINGLLITPPGYDGRKAYPLLVVLHGGPSETWFKRYLGGTIHRGKITAPFCLECLLRQGFVILEPNPRGSAYGKKFALSIFKNIGKKDVQDIMSGVDFLIQKKIADSNHLAIWGWSYGGYLVPWIISQTHRFKAAVEGAGYCDLISYSGTTDIPKLLDEYLGNPFWEDHRLYLQQSSILQVENIKTPLLILHGDKDTRIPISQAYELYTALHEQNKPVKMLRMVGQGHLPDDPNIILESMKQTHDWLEQAL